MTWCDERQRGPLHHSYEPQHGSTTSMRGSFGNLRENTFGENTSFLRLGLANRVGRESLQAPWSEVEIDGSGGWGGTAGKVE